MLLLYFIVRYTGLGYNVFTPIEVYRGVRNKFNINVVL